MEKGKHNVKGNPYLATLEALEVAGVQFVVIGGFAVVMHGATRFTPDLNIVVEFSPENFERLFAALNELSMTSDQELSAQRVLDDDFQKALLEKDERFIVFSNIEIPGFQLDVLLNSPLPYKALQRSAQRLRFSDLSVNICSQKDLLLLKEKAGRPQDKADIESIELLQAISAGQAGTLERQFSREEQDRIGNLVAFSKLSYEERVDWLAEMLSQLGSFCLR